ncbi:MAG: hypothetical protein QOF37_3135 [Thermoleophilaceae bacterium]|nr:hypothetical protein [Thermoleophilaceae bacterium]
MAAAQRSVASCRRAFLHYFPEGFRDPDYLAWERDYKWSAHRRWVDQLDRVTFAELLDAGDHAEVASRAVRIESRTNLLFSFEKMALRDAVRTRAGARAFATGLFDWLHGSGGEHARFERWLEAVDALPRRQSRLLTWPVVTVFGFLARPKVHFFLKPTVTRRAAAACGFDLDYRSRPTWSTYAEVLALTRTLRAEIADLRPRDMIDLQSFLWVQGSDEYP